VTNEAACDLFDDLTELRRMTDAQIDTARLTASASDHRGLAALPRAESFNGPLGPYTLQGSIAACFARARTAKETDGPRIVALYEALAAVAAVTHRDLKRAVAVSMA
jgi:predicted RNA polymerase sigma factor